MTPTRRGARELLGDERGIGLITAIMASFVVALLVTVSVSISLHSSTQSAYDRRRTQSIAAAEAGIDAYLSHLQTVQPTAVQCSMAGTLTARPPTRYVVTPTFYDAAGQAMACPFPSGSRPAAVRVRSVGTSSAATPARTMEAYADLVSDHGGDFGEAAFFSEETPQFSSNVQVYGSGSNNGDIYTNGDLTISANSVVYGSAYVQGALTLNSNADVKATAWSGGALKLNTNSVVRGNATSSGSSITVSGGVVYGDATAGSSITVSGKGRIHGAQIPNMPSAPPPRRELPVFTFDATQWISGGYGIQTFSECATARAALNNLPSSNLLIRIIVPCELVVDAAIMVRSNLAIVSEGGVTFRSGSGFFSEGAAPRDVFFFVGLAEVSPCDFTMESNTAFGAGIRTLIYTPCTVTLNSNGLVVEGQLFGNRVVLNANTTLNYTPVLPPGTSLGGFDENLRYIREIAT